MKKLLDVCKEAKGFAVPAPSVYSLDTVEAVYETARKLKSPVILMVWDGGKEWIEKIGNIVKFVDKKYPDVPACLHLDHGASFDSEVYAIRCGYTSVMADRSTLPFDENADYVAKLVEIAHVSNVTVEAELGHVGQATEYEETRDSGLTRPEEAAEFVKRTGVDCLAVAVGTSHGLYKGTPKIDFELLKILEKEVNVPLVIHGGSGSGDDNFREMIKIGIQKVNLCSDLFKGGTNGVKKAYAEGITNYMHYFDYHNTSWKEVLESYINLFDSKDKSYLYQDYLAKPEEKYYEKEEIVATDR